jgi:hypothetical protein
MLNAAQVSAAATLADENKRRNKIKTKKNIFLINFIVEQRWGEKQASPKLKLKIQRSKVKNLKVLNLNFAF